MFVPLPLSHALWSPHGVCLDLFFQTCVSQWKKKCVQTKPRFGCDIMLCERVSRQCFGTPCLCRRERTHTRARARFTSKLSWPPRQKLYVQGCDPQGSRPHPTAERCYAASRPLCWATGHGIAAPHSPGHKVSCQGLHREPRKGERVFRDRGLLFFIIHHAICINTYHRVADVMMNDKK